MVSFHTSRCCFLIKDLGVQALISGVSSHAYVILAICTGNFTLMLFLHRLQVHPQKDQLLQLETWGGAFSRSLFINFLSCQWCVTLVFQFFLRIDNNVKTRAVDVPSPLTSDKTETAITLVKSSAEKVKTTPAGEYLTSALNDFDPEQYDSLAAISDGANKLLMLV